ncbi:hypothetical protein [Psychroserpens jangbogonensis]|uniref:hypothetical protein n=1 Tax=Psychroserpens jangbogonensis TaxID=1484460 RepID=UPI00068E3F87|nr:hypothetical protein [Psychroserpens jangbogonensis]
MKNIVLILSLSFFFAFNASSQEEKINVEAIDNYKYVIVPLKFEFLKDVDKYQINSLTKFLFNKYGYTAFLENDPFPEDLRQNRCLALKTDLVKVKGGFLSTRLQINLMDCNGVIVASSKIGKTREKEFKVAYNLAVRDAFQTFQFYEYNYKPDLKITALPTNVSADTTKQNEEETIVAQEEIERLKQEVAALKEEKVVKQAVIVPVVITSPKKEPIETPQELTEDIKILYAQPIDKGFQVVDKTPKVIMILLETPKENTFIVKDQNAIVYKEDGFWYLSKNDGNATSLETLNIKF